MTRIAPLLLGLVLVASGCQYLVPGRARLEFRTEPPGSRLFLDGRDQGCFTPGQGRTVWIPPFTDERVLRLEFVAEGRQRVVHWKRVFWGTLYTMYVTLPANGTPSFLPDTDSGRWCEETRIDGRAAMREQQGVGWLLAPGEHEIEVRNGYQFRLHVTRGRFTLPPETQFAWAARDVEAGHVDAVHDLVDRDETPNRSAEEDRRLEERVMAALRDHPRFSAAGAHATVKHGIVECHATFEMAPGERGEAGLLRAFLSPMPGVAFVNDYSGSHWGPAPGRE